jgi:ribulose kinase
VVCVSNSLVSGMSKHYIGIDVGTGSARACIINEEGEIVADASKDISLWKPKEGYYVRIYDSQI